jgi:hypothetical protein
MKVTASCTLHGEGLVNLPVLNPGEYYGDCYLIVHAIGYSTIACVVEAQTESDAIDVLADSEEFGYWINVDDCALGDYPEDDRCYAGNDGHVVDLENIMIYSACKSDRRDGEPVSIRYHFATPPEGIPSNKIDQFLTLLD